jgi:hypothetical protein
MLQGNKLDQVIGHFQGKLTKGYPRRVVVHKTIDELRAAKIPLFNAWSVRFDIPLDMAMDCEQAMRFIQNRLITFKDAGFKLIELSAEIRPTKLNRDSKDNAIDEPFWSGMFVHRERKDPRKVVKNCLPYDKKNI